MTRTFFRRNGAEIFADTMRSQGYDNATIWTDTDGFRQRIYIVKW